MIVTYEEKLRREQTKCLIEGFVINSFILYYFLVGLYYLGFLFAEADMGDFAYNLHVLLGLLPVGAIAGWIWSRSPWSPGRVFVETTNDFVKGLRPERHRSWLLMPSGLFTLFVVLETFVLGWSLTQVDLYNLFSVEGLSGARRIFQALFTPKWDILGDVLAAMVETIFIAFMATAIAIPVAFIGSFFCARNLMRGSLLSVGIYNVLRVIFNFMRSVEPLIWAIVFSVWVGIGPFAGMLALMIHSVASLIKLYSEQIENIDRGPMEAIEATGANRIQVVWYAVVPQIVLPYLSFTIYRWDINIRMATIIGLVGGGGVGTMLMQYQGLALWNHVGMIVLVIAAVVWFMDYVSARVREAIY